MSAPYWIDVFSDIVAGVRADADKPATLDTDEPFYMHGHPLEIIDILAQKDQHKTHKYNRYPLIALFQDFTESMGENQGIQSTAELNIIIADQTSQDYNAEERYDNTFRTVLYPLYDLLLEHIDASGWFSVGIGLIPHDKIDRLFWGRSGLYGNETNIFNDHLDAIEIQNLSLSMLLKQKCNGL